MGQVRTFWPVYNILHLLCTCMHTATYYNTALLLLYRTLWICVHVRMSSRASCSPWCISTLWWSRGGSLGRRDGIAPTHTTPEISPSVSMSSSTTWKLTLRYIAMYVIQVLQLLDWHDIILPLSYWPCKYVSPNNHLSDTLIVRLSCIFSHVKVLVGHTGQQKLPATSMHPPNHHYINCS